MAWCSLLFFLTYNGIALGIVRLCLLSKGTVIGFLIDVCHSQAAKGYPALRRLWLLGLRPRIRCNDYYETSHPTLRCFSKLQVRTKEDPERRSNHVHLRRSDCHAFLNTQKYDSLRGR